MEVPHVRLANLGNAPSISLPVHVSNNSSSVCKNFTGLLYTKISMPVRVITLLIIGLVTPVDYALRESSVFFNLRGNAKDQQSKAFYTNVSISRIT